MRSAQQRLHTSSKPAALTREELLAQLALAGSARFYPRPAEFGPDYKILAYRLDKVSFDTYDQVRSDPVVAFALRMLKLPLLRAKWSIACDDPWIAAFCARAAQPHLYNLRKRILSAWEFGFSTTELVWQNETLDITAGQANAQSAQSRTFHNAWTVRRLVQMDPKFTWLTVHPDGSLAGARQFIGGGAEIPSEKLVHYAGDAEFEEVYGTPMSKRAVPFWEQKLFVMENAGLYHRRFGVPSLYGRAPGGLHEAGEGETTSRIQQLLDILYDFASGHNVALPADRDAFGNLLWDISILETETSHDFTPLLEWFDRQIWQCFFIPELAAQSSKHGTQSLGESQIDLMMDNELAWAEELQEVINTQFLARLVKYNFGENAPPARLTLTLDESLVKQLVQSVSARLAQGEPLLTAAGDALLLDTRKLLEDSAVPTETLSRADYREMLGDSDRDAEAQQTQDDGDNRNDQENADEPG